MCRPGRERYFMVPPGWVSRHRAILVIRDVSVQREERNPQRFWVSVLSALRQTAVGLPWCGL